MSAIHRCRKQDPASRQLAATDPNAWAVGAPMDAKEDPTSASFSATFQPGSEPGVLMNKGDVCKFCGTVIG